MSGARELVARYGSPLYVYRLDEVAAAHAELQRSLPRPSTLFYSLKANPHPDLVQALLARGCRAEVSSPTELAVALAAGARPGECLYTGPGKSDAEIAHALAAGVLLFSCESTLELARLEGAAASHQVGVDCLLRVNDDHIVAGSGLRMSGTASQFGTDLSRILAEPEGFRGGEHARVVGAHLYTATNVRQPRALLRLLEASIDSAVRLRERARLPLEQLDLGGGFAAPYARAGARPCYEFRDRLEKVLDERLPGWREGDPRVAFESGRYLVAGCGTLVCSVVDVKRSKGRTFVVLDAGVNHLGGLAGLGRLLPPVAEPLLEDDDGCAGREPMTVDLVGPLCTPTDVLGRGVRVPAPRLGDTLLIPNVGAYGLTASLLAFLGRQTPVEVVLRGGEPVSSTRLALHRSTVEAQRP